jgi:hypothetical protein
MLDSVAGVVVKHRNRVFAKTLVSVFDCKLLNVCDGSKIVDHVCNPGCA